MTERVRAVLVSGPEDGREITIPPFGQFTVSARRTRDPDAPPEEPPPLLLYDRDDQRPDGTWRYRYAGIDYGTTTAHLAV